jgi:hypothetical protein
MGGNPPPKGFVEKLTCTSNNGSTVSLSNDKFSVAISGPKEELEYFQVGQRYVVAVDQAPE